MKTKILIFITLLISGLGLGQECSNITEVNKKIKCLEAKINALKLADDAYHTGKHSEIIVDFSAKQKVIPLPQELVSGDFYQIKVENINLNKWNVLINTVDTTISNKLNTPTFADLQLDALNVLVDAINSSTSLQMQTESLGIGLESVANTSNVNKALLNLEKVSPQKLVQNEIIEKINNTNEFLSKKTTTHNSLSSQIDNLKYNVAKAQLAALDDSNKLDSDFNVDKALSEIEALRKSLKKLQDELGTNEKDYLSFSEKKKAKIEADKNYKKADKAIKERFSGLKGNVGKMQAVLKAENAISMLKSILFLKNKEEDYVSLPIQFKSELAEVSLQFMPKDSLLGESPRTIEFIFPTQKKGYWSVDASFYASSLYSESFSSISEVVSETQREVTFVEEDVTKAEIGVATLIRRGFNSTDPDKGLHLVFGPGVSISEKVRPRLLFGGGYSIGEKQAFSIDFGAITGYVDRKSNAFELNDTLSEVPNSLTVSRLKVGIFVAFGYIFKL